MAKPQLRLLSVDHALGEAFAAAGLGDVRVQARICPERGLVVDLAGPESTRAAAIELAGLYPVVAVWQPSTGSRSIGA